MLIQRLFLLTLAATGAASAALSDLSPPPWIRWDPSTSQFNERSIYATWDFPDEFDNTPDNLATVDSNPWRCPICPNVLDFPSQAEYQSLGVGDGLWAIPSGQPVGQAVGQLTNMAPGTPAENDPSMLGRAQITWTGTIPPNFLITSGFDLSVFPTGLIPNDGGSIINNGAVATTPLGGGRFHTLYTFEIFPSPNNYNFRIDMPVGTGIDGLIIDTRSIPEPGALVLLGFAGLGLLRRRRA